VTHTFTPIVYTVFSVAVTQQRDVKVHISANDITKLCPETCCNWLQQESWL